MPTYDYKCRECDHAFEIQQSFTDDALTECPECGGPLRKVFGAVGISFKGSGFYKTDSRSGSSSRSSSSSGSSSDTKSGSDSTSSSSTTTSDAGSSSGGATAPSGSTAA